MRHAAGDRSLWLAPQHFVKIAVVWLPLSILVLAGCGSDQVRQRIAALKSGNREARERAAAELGTLKDRRAVRDLCAALKTLGPSAL